VARLAAGYRSIAGRPAAMTPQQHGGQQQWRRSSTAGSSKGEQCHVYSRRRRLNTD